MAPLLEALASLLLLLGGIFTLLGSVALLRLPDTLTRLHGPTKATTLGVGGIVLATLLHAGWEGGGGGLRALAITLFLLITAPVAAHLLARAAIAERDRKP